MSKHEEENIFEGNLVDFHPALDFKGGKAYVAVKLHTETKKGLRKKPWIITSDKECFRFSHEELTQRGLFSEVYGIFVEDRWSKDGIDGFLNGKEDFVLSRIFVELKKLFQFYLDYADERLYTLLPLWVIGTYFFPLFNGYPILFLTGSTGSGKSKTGEISSCLCFNARQSSNISDAGLFRIIHASRGTLILDENEKVSGFGDQCSQINFLLGGYKPGANVIRTKALENGSFRPEEYQIYAPKMIANIRGIRETALLNRSIKLVMTPSQKAQSNREVDIYSVEFKVLRNKLYVHLMNHWKEVEKAKQTVKRMNLGLSGYDFLNWLPILALAYLLGKKQLDQMLQFAREKVKENKELGFENDNLYRLFSVIMNLSVNKERKIAGNEWFYEFDFIYQAYLKEMGVQEDSESKIVVPPYLSKQSVGRMIEHLQIGRDARVHVGGKLVRGRWLSSSSIKQTQERFGYPSST